MSSVLDGAHISRFPSHDTAHYEPRVEHHKLFVGFTQVDHQTSHRCRCGKRAPTVSGSAK